MKELALRPSYWANVSGGKDSLYMLKFILSNPNEHYDFMISKMRETENIMTEKYNRPFSVISSNPKYNSDYLDNTIKTKWLTKLNELENNPG